MRPGFQCDPTARHSTEHFAQPIRIGPDSLLQSYLAGFVHHAVPTVAIPQIQTNCQFRLRKTLRLLCCCSANLLHCRSPLSLALQSASITWERTASRRRPAFSSHLLATANHSFPASTISTACRSAVKTFSRFASSCKKSGRRSYHL